MNGQATTTPEPQTPLYVNPAAPGNKGISTGILGVIALIAGIAGYSIPGLPAIDPGTALVVLFPVVQNLFHRFGERRKAKKAAKAAEAAARNALPR